MILICGIPTETPMAMVREQLDALGLAYEVLHQRRFAETAIEIEVAAGEVRGRLTIGRRTLPCAEITGAYTRLMVGGCCPRWRTQRRASRPSSSAGIGTTR